MIKIAKLTDYAVVLLGWLGRVQDSAAVSAALLSQETGFPEPTVAKVLKKLAQAKLVVSERGVSGGYRIARPASAISIRDVIEALDGPIAIASCVDAADMTCQAASICVSRGRWNPVNEVIRKALSDITVQDMTPDTMFSKRQVMQIKEGAHVGLS